MVQEKIEYICHKIAGYKERDQVLTLSNVWDAYSGDVITEYAFGFSYENLKSDDFQDTFHDAFLAVSAFGHTSLQFPWLASFLNSLPDSVVGAMNPPLEKLLKLQRVS
jgi:hypothetical protein